MKKHIKAVDARGRKLGGDTPLLGTPLVGRTRERLLAEAASVLQQKPDIIEWRVDFFDAIGDTKAVLDTGRALRETIGKRPIIFTCRAERGGGETIALGEADVVELYAAVAASRLVDFIDFEVDNDPEHLRRVRECTRQNEIRLILSYHNMSYTPGLEHLVDRFLEAERLGADVAMVQVMPRDRADVLRLLAATAEADDKTRIPLISMSLGPLGSVSRMVGGLFGSWLSFAVGESASAPGQIPIGDLVTMYDIIRRSRGGEMLTLHCLPPLKPHHEDSHDQRQDLAIAHFGTRRVDQVAAIYNPWVDQNGTRRHCRADRSHGEAFPGVLASPRKRRISTGAGDEAAQGDGRHLFDECSTMVKIEGSCNVARLRPDGTPDGDMCDCAGLARGLK